jgi:hypothetical protein
MADTTECSPYALLTGGGPSRSFDTKWQTETVLALAKAIEAEDAFDRLPILADALEESGCDNIELLRHCRECERHGPWCWVLRTVLVAGSKQTSAGVEWDYDDMPAIISPEFAVRYAPPGTRFRDRHVLIAWLLSVVCLFFTAVLIAWEICRMR